MTAICVYCGSASGRRPIYLEGARALGQALVSRGLDLVYGGAHVGLMGALADATLAAGGRVIGVIPEFLAGREVAHSRLTELVVVDSMHTRKAQLAERADGFIAMPGGLGTLEELFEMLTWAQLGFHQKPIGLLNIGEYYQPLLALLERGSAEGFINAATAPRLFCDADPDLLLQQMLEGGA